MANHAKLGLFAGRRLLDRAEARAAILSLTFWLLVILGGRLLPTFEAYGDGDVDKTPAAAPAP